MILCLDAGNTRLKIGAWQAGGWQQRAALDYADLDRWAADAPLAVSCIVACNVAGDAVAGQIEALAARLARPIHWVRSSAHRCGVRNAYTQPEQLGADRWAALIAARGRQLAMAMPCPLLVVMAGTATTIDGLGADGDFHGGLILPGISLMRQSLARNTAQLPSATGAFRRWPTDTEAAIVSGSIDATTGAIERLHRRLSSQAKLPVHCLLGGGAADAIASQLEVPLTRTPDLVLEGLLRIAQAERDA